MAKVTPVYYQVHQFLVLSYYIHYFVRTEQGNPKQADRIALQSIPLYVKNIYQII